MINYNKNNNKYMNINNNIKYNKHNNNKKWQKYFVYIISVKFK